MVDFALHSSSAKPVEGGWVSYVVPAHNKRVHLGDTKPYFAPYSVEALEGPDSGLIQLPIHLYWGPARWFNLLHRATLRDVYQMIIEEGAIEDMKAYLNREVLLSIWDDLHLPARITHLWEDKVEGLRDV